MPSPATFDTPANIHATQEDILQFGKDNKKVEDLTEEPENKLSLDQYLNSHTSQDNESFEEILDVSHEKHRDKYKYLYQVEDNSKGKLDAMLALPSVEQQAALPEKPFNVDTWG